MKHENVFKSVNIKKFKFWGGVCNIPKKYLLSPFSCFFAFSLPFDLGFTDLKNKDFRILHFFLNGFRQIISKRKIHCVEQHIIL